MNLLAGALAVIVIVIPSPPSADGGAEPSAPALPGATSTELTPPLDLPPVDVPGVPDPGGTVGSVAGAVKLSGWKLTLPTASSKGAAASVEPADQSPPWLTKGDDGSIKFWAPVKGAKTPNSQHPRTELVSLSNWKAGSGKHTLRASLQVGQVPTGNGDIIIGQIHGADDIKSVPFVMLHYANGEVRVVVKKGQSGPTSDKIPLISGVPLNAKFDYTITDSGDGKLLFTATCGSNTKQATAEIPAPFKNATVRFQAGAYQQGTGGGGDDDGARVTFYTLDDGGASAP